MCFSFISDCSVDQPIARPGDDVRRWHRIDISDDRIPTDLRRRVMAQAKQYTSARWAQRAMRRPKPSETVRKVLDKIGVGYDSDDPYPPKDSGTRAGRVLQGRDSHGKDPFPPKGSSGKTARGKNG